jgi:hypothetical protein
MKPSIRSGRAVLFAALLATAPGPREISASDLACARAAIARLGEQMEKVDYLRADYRQEQNSLLLSEPLESSGLLRLRADPPCLLLELELPRRVIVRSDATSHRTYWPDEKRAERWVFRSNDLARTLVRCFGPGIARLEESFEIREWIPGETTDVVVCVPRKKEFERFLVELRLVLRRADGWLVEVAHANADGEAVRFELSNMVLEPDPKEEAPHFAPELPAGVTELVHRVEQER